MRFTLKDYQNDAVGQMLRNLADARDDWHRKRRNVAFSLTATTGAGKTVMAAAVIEALFDGNDDFNFRGRPRRGCAVVHRRPVPQRTDSVPAAGSCRRPHRPLAAVVIENTFNQEKFEPGKVYFLNAQKLSKNSLLVRGAHEDDEGQLSGRQRRHRTCARTRSWDTLTQHHRRRAPDARTSSLTKRTEGMKPTTRATEAEKSTIVQRLDQRRERRPAGAGRVGHLGDRRALQQKRWLSSDGRYPYPPSRRRPCARPGVRTAQGRHPTGLPSRDGQVRHGPAQAGVPERSRSPPRCGRATPTPGPHHRSRCAAARRSGAQHPIGRAAASSAFDTIRDEWPDLPTTRSPTSSAITAAIELGGYVVPYISPEKVQERTHVRVLLAKDAISTGWDCPRAEVLVSFRPATGRNAHHAVARPDGAHAAGATHSRK